MQKLISTLCCLVIAKHTVNGDNALRFFPNNANSELDGILANGQQGEHWALLVAGSNGWYNYRHQVCITVNYLRLLVYYKLMHYFNSLSFMLTLLKIV